MSHPQMASVTALRQSHHPSDLDVVDTDEEIQLVLNALGDKGCRAILEAVDGERLSARKLSETCDLPLSTTYRKLDQLTEAELILERTRISLSGKHTSEYVRAVDDVVVCVDADEGTQLEVAHRERSEPRHT
ncbi:MAG: helix-turn-helix domain-containing protein [Halobacteriota archaeon]